MKKFIQVQHASPFLHGVYLNMFQNITYEDALKFRIFFNSTCIDDYFHIREKQEKMGGAANYTGNSSSNNNIMGGGRSIKRRYKFRKTCRKTSTRTNKIHKSKKHFQAKQKLNIGI